MATIFQVSSFLTLPFWLLMIALPTWRWTRRIIASPAIILPAALLYSILVIPQLGSLAPILANPNLSALAAALGSPVGATIAWAHFLAFDLFVGRWCYLDSRQRAIHPLLMAPTLFLILMVGPIGLLTYLAIRTLAALRNPVSPSPSAALHP